MLNRLIQTQDTLIVACNRLEKTCASLQVVNEDFKERLIALEQRMGRCEGVLTNL
jgi:hypothetical protein